VMPRSSGPGCGGPQRTPLDGGTLVAIAHSGLPDGERPRHALGWRHYLARLSRAAMGGGLAPHVTPDEIIQGAD
jgi:hypothetical protein